MVSAQAWDAYRQTPSRLLHGSVCKGRSGIWECLWGPCGAVRAFLSDWNGPIQLSPSECPTSETCREKNTVQWNIHFHSRIPRALNIPQHIWLISQKLLVHGLATLPAECSWCVFGQVAEGLFWLSPLGGKRGLGLSGAYSPQWYLSSPAGGSKQSSM